MVLSHFSIRRPVSISMIVIGILILGFVSSGKIPVTLLPEISYPKITVRTDYPQAAPNEVETIVTRPIEQTVGIVNNVIRIGSESRPGVSDVIVEFSWGTDLDTAVMDIREKLQLLEFPDEVEKPRILRYDPNSDPIMKLGITGNLDLAALRALVEREIEIELERIDGVAAVRVQGGYEDEIVVDVDARRLAQYGLTFSQLVDRISRENITLAGGTLREADTELALRTTNQFETIEDIQELIIASGGTPAPDAAAGMGGVPAPPTTPPARTGDIRLKDVATVEQRHKQREEIARLNGRECVEVSIFKEGGANVVAVSESLRTALGRIQDQLAAPGARGAAAPRMIHGLHIETILDQAVFIENSISAVVTSAILGGAIAILILYFFLRRFVTTIIISLAIPISIITTFILMYFCGISWNIMSLGGIALGVGMLVDNSIVVLENIFRLGREKTDMGEAAQEGTDEVASAITASTLTNISVFFPIVFVVGIAGQIFKDLAWTVVFSLVASELVAFTVIPMLAVLLRARETDPEASDPVLHRVTRLEPPSFTSRHPGRFLVQAVKGAVYGVSRGGEWAFRHPLAWFDRGFGRLRVEYPRVLRNLLGQPRRVLGVSLLAAAGAGGVFFFLGQELLPSVDQGEYTLNIQLEVGTPIERTDTTFQKVENVLASVRDTAAIDTIFSTIGFTTTQVAGTATQKSENIGEINVILKDTRAIEDETSMTIVRRALAQIVGMELTMSKPALLSYRTPVQIEISGHDLATLKKTATQVVEEIRHIEGLYDIESTAEESNPEITIHIDRARAADMNLTIADITTSITQAVKGETATTYDEGAEQLDIVVRATERQRNTARDLGALPIPLPNGKSAPLRTIARITPAEGPGAIHRSGNSRVALITANITGRPLGDVADEIEQRLAGLTLPPGYYTAVTGQNTEMQESLRSLLGATVLAVILVYIVLASQFESLLHPFVIMFTVPFSLVGVSVILLVTGISLNIFTFIGIMMMVGIAVNDAIVFIETVNLNRRRGYAREEAIVAAGRTRLRPIMITTATTVLGMTPMAVMGGEGAELRAPTAIAVIGGLLSSTMFTLLAIPSVYMLIDGLGDRLRTATRRDVTASEVPDETGGPGATTAAVHAPESDPQ